MDKVNSDGRMEENMKGNGSEVNNMESGYIEIIKERKEKENGQMEREQTGLIDSNRTFIMFNIFSILIFNAHLL